MKKSNIEHLNTVTAKDLYGMDLRPPQFVVEGLLPQGLHVFAGPPKIGKSWLLLQLAVAVSSGKSLWGLETERGTVLSLCLEDNYPRLQQRLSQLTDEPPGSLHLATLSKSLADGLCEQLTDFVREHSDTNLIIIDTLQRVRGNSNDSNLYASDYQDISLLKRIADELDLAIVLVHHLRKREASAPRVMISGTTGLVGAADGSYVLCRESPGESEANLFVRGRDIEEKTLTLTRDEELGEWVLVSCDTALTDDLNKEPALLSVIDYVKAVRTFEGTATELAELLHLDLQPNILTRKIGRYRQELMKAGISFSPSRTGKQRLISLRWHDGDGMTVPPCGERESSQNAKPVGNTEALV